MAYVASIEMIMFLKSLFAQKIAKLAYALLVHCVSLMLVVMPLYVSQLAAKMTYAITSANVYNAKANMYFDLVETERCQI